MTRGKMDHFTELTRRTPKRNNRFRFEQDIPFQLFYFAPVFHFAPPSAIVYRAGFVQFGAAGSINYPSTKVANFLEYTPPPFPLHAHLVCINWSLVLFFYFISIRGSSYRARAASRSRGPEIRLDASLPA